MAERFTMKTNDLEPSFEVQLLDGSTPVDLTSAMGVLFIMRNRKGVKAIGAMNVADQTASDTVGIVTYTWVLGDTDTVGTYQVEVEVTWPGLRQQTFPAAQYLIVSVQKSLSPVGAS